MIAPLKELDGEVQVSVGGGREEEEDEEELLRLKKAVEVKRPKL